MLFLGQSQERFYITEINSGSNFQFENDLKTGLSIVWNVGRTAKFMIDGIETELHTNCVFFTTAAHKVIPLDIERLNVVHFNKSFYCLENHDEKVGCRGMLFFGSYHVPKIVIPNAEIEKFGILWKVLLMEVDEMDDFTLDMLRSMVKRLLILCLRLFKEQHENLGADNVNVGIIKEFNYLVEKHFKEYTKVHDYAMLLHRSPKTLSNIFKKYIDKTPLEIIKNRRLLEAKRLLAYTEDHIQEIADELKFADVQSFSHFFKSMYGKSPSYYRKSLISKAS